MLFSLLSLLILGTFILVTASRHAIYSDYLMSKTS